MLGTGDALYEDMWRRSRGGIPIACRRTIGFDERLAHLIEAGARHVPDAVAVRAVRPEPDVQPALRHGPVVRATGGLDDTVADDDARPAAGTGFKFRDYTPEALVWARAAGPWRAFANPTRWKAMQLAGMRQDYSWDVSAREYVKVYRARRSG